MIFLKAAYFLGGHVLTSTLEDVPFHFMWRARTARLLLSWCDVSVVIVSGLLCMHTCYYGYDTQWRDKGVYHLMLYSKIMSHPLNPKPWIQLTKSLHRRKIVQFYATIHNHQEWVEEGESLRTESRYNTICLINHTHLSLRFLRVHAKHQPSHSEHPDHHPLVYCITVFNRRGGGRALGSHQNYLQF